MFQSGTSDSQVVKGYKRVSVISCYDLLVTGFNCLPSVKYHTHTQLNSCKLSKKANTMTFLVAQYEAADNG